MENSMNLLEGVDSKNKELNDIEDDYTLLEDVKAGDRQVKKQGTLYLPMLEGQKIKAYKAYKDRGVFYNATSRTITGLTGALMRKPAVIEAPPKIESMFDRITPDGYNIQETIKSTTDALLTYGRHGILVDFNAVSQQVYFTEYNAPSILNWRTELINGERILTFLSLAELDERQDDSDEFNTIYYEQIRVLKLDDESGKLVVNLYERQIPDPTGGATKAQDYAGWSQVEVITGSKDHYPVKMGGEKLDYIPFVFFGAIRNTPDVNKPPLLDLADVNIAHWRITCDYYHGLHYCALPTPYALGIRSKEKFTIGPSVAIVSENENAKVGMLEFSGQGLDAVRMALKDLEQKMAVLGARLLEEQKRAAEAAETLIIRSAGDAATLASISNNLDRGFEEAILYTMYWHNLPNVDSKEISVKTNKDYVSSQLDSAQITALLKAYQMGSISQRTFLYNMKQGEILPDNVTIEDEQDEILADDNKPFETEAVEPAEEEEEEEDINDRYRRAQQGLPPGQVIPPGQENKTTTPPGQERRQNVGRRSR